MDNPDFNVNVKTILQKRPVAKTAFQRIHVGVLKQCCELLELEVARGGKRNASIKRHFEEALLKYVRKRWP